MALTLTLNPNNNPNPNPNPHLHPNPNPDPDPNPDPNPNQGVQNRKRAASSGGIATSAPATSTAADGQPRKRIIGRQDTASSGMLGKIADRAGAGNAASGNSAVKSAFGGKTHLKHLINKVATTVHVKHHRERVTFVRSMFCRHLKLRYDNLVRTQLQGHPHLAIELRGSVDAASDMLRQSELNTKEVHGATVSQHGQSAPLAGPQLAPCASSGHAWRLWLARHTPRESPGHWVPIHRLGCSS